MQSVITLTQPPIHLHNLLFMVKQLAVGFRTSNAINTGNPPNNLTFWLSFQQVSWRMAHPPTRFAWAVILAPSLGQAVPAWLRPVNNIFPTS